MSAPASGSAITLRARRRNETRLEIQRAALDLFERQGFDQTTVDEIARAAGISPRTYFRYCATKEDSVLGDMHGFDEAVQACIAAASADDHTLSDFSLSNVEAAFRTVIESFRQDQNEVAATILRIRKLVCAHSTLSKAALGHCAENTQKWLMLTDQHCPATTRSRIRMILEIGQLTVQCAFDEWVNASAQDQPGADLLTIYDEVCARVRNL